MASLADFRQYGITSTSLIRNSSVVRDGVIHLRGNVPEVASASTVFRVIVNGESWGFLTAWTLFSKQHRRAWTPTAMFNWHIDKRWCSTFTKEHLQVPHASFQGYGDTMPDMQHGITKMQFLEEMILERLKLLALAAATPLPPPLRKVTSFSSGSEVFALPTETDVLRDRITFFLVRSMFQLLMHTAATTKEEEKMHERFKTWCYWEKLLVQHRLRCSSAALPDSLVEAWIHACFSSTKKAKLISLDQMPATARQEADMYMGQFSHWWQLQDVLMHCPSLLKLVRREYTMVAFMHRGTLYASPPWIAANIDVIAGTVVAEQMCSSQRARELWLTEDRLRISQLHDLARYCLLCFNKAIQKLPGVGDLASQGGGWVPSGFHSAVLPVGHLLRSTSFPDLSNMVPIPACINEIQSPSLPLSRTMNNTMRQVWARVMVDLGANRNGLLNYWQQRSQNMPDPVGRMNGLKSVLQSASQNALTGLRVSCDKMIKNGYCPYARDPEIGAKHARESCFVHAPLSIGGAKERVGVHFDIKTPASFVRRHIHVAFESASSSSSVVTTRVFVPFKRK